MCVCVCFGGWVSEGGGGGGGEEGYLMLPSPLICESHELYNALHCRGANKPLV